MNRYTPEAKVVASSSFEDAEDEHANDLERPLIKHTSQQVTNNDVQGKHTFA